VGSINFDLDSLEIIPASCHFSIFNPLLSRVRLRWKTKTVNHYIFITHDAMYAIQKSSLHTIYSGRG
jgi:hypothetical protein